MAREIAVSYTHLDVYKRQARGYRVEGGRIAGSVHQITLAGNFFSLLKDVEAVGGDLKFPSPSNVAFGSPSLLLPALSVAGK